MQIQDNWVICINLAYNFATKFYIPINLCMFFYCLNFAANKKER